MGALRVAANLGEVALDKGKHVRALLETAASDKLLAKIVAIRVNHDPSERRAYIAEYKLNKIIVCPV